MRPWTGPRHDDQNEHDVGHPRAERGLPIDGGDVHGGLRAHARDDRHAAESADRLRPPYFRKSKQHPERHQRAGDVGQVRAEEHGHWPLPGDIRQRSDDGERPRFLHAFGAADQKQQHPRRKQRENRDDVPDRSREAEERQSGNRRERDERRAERAVRYRRIIRQRRHANRIEVGDADADENRRDDGPWIPEADQSLEQRAERPREHERLDPHVARRVVNQPALEVIEVAGRDQRVEDDQAPERDPVDGPHTLQSAVQIRVCDERGRCVPDDDRNSRCHDAGDQRREPGRHAQAGEQREQHDKGNEGDKDRQPQAAQRDQRLSEHGGGVYPGFRWFSGSRANGVRRAAARRLRGASILPCRLR